MATPQINWIKFAEILAERYEYLLNADLCLHIAQDAREFAKEAFQDGEHEERK